MQPREHSGCSYFYFLLLFYYFSLTQGSEGEQEPGWGNSAWDSARRTGLSRPPLASCAAAERDKGAFGTAEHARPAQAAAPRTPSRRGAPVGRPRRHSLISSRAARPQSCRQSPPAPRCRDAERRQRQAVEGEPLLGCQPCPVPSPVPRALPVLCPSLPPLRSRRSSGSCTCSHVHPRPPCPSRRVHPPFGCATGAEVFSLQNTHAPMFHTRVLHLARRANATGTRKAARPRSAVRGCSRRAGALTSRAAWPRSRLSPRGTASARLPGQQVHRVRACAGAQLAVPLPP